MKKRARESKKGAKKKRGNKSKGGVCQRQDKKKYKDYAGEESIHQRSQ